MKKAYVKPQIMFEDFSLTTNIAGDCGEIVKTPTSGTCGFDFSGVTVFITGVTGCESGIVVDNFNGDAQYNGLCYHVPVAGNNLFNS